MQFVSGASAELCPRLLSDMGRYRHRVFVEKLGWSLQCEGALEYDQFDRPDTLYVLAQNAAQEVVGIARLLPTTQPYLLGEVFPQLLNGLPPPHSSDTWELSRFAAVDFQDLVGSTLEQFSSSICARLLHRAVACAVAQGARRLVSVSPVGVERLLRLAGYQAHRLAPPMLVDGQPIFACSFACG